MKKTLGALIGAMFCIAMMFSLVACGASNTADRGSKEAPSSRAEAVSSSSSEATSPSDATITSSSSTDANSASSGKVSNSNGKKVYFAAPLFNQGEKDFNLRLTKVLEDHGYEVFLPQRDGFLAAELEGMSDEEKTQKIFDKDCNEILKADVLFMVLDGMSPDEGACVELGIAYANDKRCYAVKTDARAVELNMDNNPMITGCCTKIFKNFDGDKLIEELERHLSENEL